MAELVYPPVIRLALTYLRVAGVRLHVEGSENVPRAGGAVVAINHVGYLDFVMAGVPAWFCCRRLVRYMAKQEVFDHPVAGPLMRGMHHIPVDRVAGAASYRAAVEALRRGELVGVFPEATISRSFELKEFKTGAVRMAADAGVPVVPVVVWGSQRILTKGRPRNKARGIAVSVAVGEPLMPTGDALQATGELKQAMQVLLDRLQRNYPQQPAGPEDRWWLPARLGGTAMTPEEAAQLERADVEVRAARRAAREAQAADGDSAAGGGR